MKRNDLPAVLRQVVLGPVMLLQGIWVRKRTPVLPEPDGPRRGRRGAGPLLRLLVVGDSSAAGVGVTSQAEALLGCLIRELRPCYEVAYRLVARTGASTRDTIEALAGMEAQPYDVVVTALGINDLTAQRRKTAFRFDQQRLIDLLNTRFTPRVILISGLPPVHRFPALPKLLRRHLGTRARAYNVALEKLATVNATLFLPLDFPMDTNQMAADGFHPGPEIYAEWGHRTAVCIHDRLQADHTIESASWRRDAPPN